jgi:hypothetical protein
MSQGRALTAFTTIVVLVEADPGKASSYGSSLNIAAPGLR